MPPIEVKTEDLEHDLHQVCWDDAHGVRLAPMDVIKVMAQAREQRVTLEELSAQRPELAKHFARVQNAQTTHPLLVANIGGEPIIIDGMHRLAKLYLDGVAQVQIKRFDALPDEAKVATES